MENQELDSFAEGGFINSGNVRTLSREIAKWAKFLGIVGFVGTGLIALGALSIMVTGSLASAFMQEGNPLGAIGGVGIGIIYLLTALLTFFPARYTYSFSQKINAALQHDDDQLLAEALQPLKSLFKFYGIITAVVLIFYALAIVFAIIGGVAGVLS